ncbi:hypothetical protein EYF80_021266 [Liparis tanakae]|uniref:Uncharacterized protein n=1 Tax=Liparis tanakae TaxID=230148 RepID=A0A4Z2HSF4_9TELE|nr:hypothetical protein EYF80_021266 [Liparis tanakae]
MEDESHTRELRADADGDDDSYPTFSTEASELGLVTRFYSRGGVQPPVRFLQGSVQLSQLCRHRLDAALSVDSLAGCVQLPRTHIPLRLGQVYVGPRGVHTHPLYRETEPNRDEGSLQMRINVTFSVSCGSGVVGVASGWSRWGQLLVSTYSNCIHDDLLVHLSHPGIRHGFHHLSREMERPAAVALSPLFSSTTTTMCVRELTFTCSASRSF